MLNPELVGSMLVIGMPVLGDSHRGEAGLFWRLASQGDGYQHFHVRSQ